jgi:flagellar basal body-associated protein FliL
MTEEDYQKERDDLAREASAGTTFWIVVIVLILLALVGGGLYLYFTFFSNPS